MSQLAQRAEYLLSKIYFEDIRPEIKSNDAEILITYFEKKYAISKEECESFCIQAIDCRENDTAYPNYDNIYDAYFFNFKVNELILASQLHLEDTIKVIVYCITSEINTQLFLKNNNFVNFLKALLSYNKNATYFLRSYIYLKLWTHYSWLNNLYSEDTELLYFAVNFSSIFLKEVNLFNFDFIHEFMVRCLKYESYHMCNNIFLIYDTCFSLEIKKLLDMYMFKFICNYVYDVVCASYEESETVNNCILKYCSKLNNKLLTMSYNYDPNPDGDNDPDEIINLCNKSIGDILIIYCYQSEQFIVKQIKQHIFNLCLVCELDDDINNDSNTITNDILRDDDTFNYKDLIIDL